MSYDRLKKERQNVQTYSRRVQGGVAARVTVPMLHPHHIENVVKNFRNVADNFENVLNNKKMPKWEKVSYCKYRLYELHRQLLLDADESHFNTPGIDFRGCR